MKWRRELVPSKDEKEHYAVFCDDLLVGRIHETYHPTIRYEAYVLTPHVASLRCQTLDEGQTFIQDATAGPQCPKKGA